MVIMVLEPRYSSADPATRKLLYYVCDETGRCFEANEIALSGSSSVKSKSRFDNEKSVSEILLGEKPYDG